MSHEHFCCVAGHYWRCGGTALRGGETEPSACACVCGLPLERLDHSGCRDCVELLACPEHREEGRRRTEEARKEHDQQRAESGFDEKWKRMKALTDGPEKHALAKEIVQWLFR